MKKGYVYMATNKKYWILYIWVTSYIHNRVLQHKEKVNPRSFSAKYNCNRVVYIQEFSSILEAIETEKRLKNGIEIGR
jgi:putative endonuclease